MSRGLLVLGVLAALTCASGCRCFPGFARYADFMDDVGDDEWAFDQWYNPRLDISRAGKPDWCGPFNRTLGGCRCCNQPTWSWADCCWRYPARHRYYYPGQVVPPPGMVMPSAAPPKTPASPYYPPPPPLPVQQPAEQAPQAQPPNPFEETPPAANPVPALPAPPFPDPQAFRIPVIANPPIVASPVFEPPLQ